MQLGIEDILGESGLSKAVEVEFSAADVGVHADDCEFGSPFLLKAEISNIGGIVRMKGRVSLKYGTFCARCLKPLTCGISADIDEDFVKADLGAILEGEDLYTYEGNSLALDRAIGAAILLQVPIRHLCGDDCKSLCTACGKDLNQGDCGCGKVVSGGPFDALAGFFGKEEPD